MSFPDSITNALRLALIEHLESAFAAYASTEKEGSITASRPTRNQSPDRQALAFAVYEGGQFQGENAHRVAHTLRFRCGLEIAETTYERLETQRSNAAEALWLELHRLSETGLEIEWQGRTLRGFAGCTLTRIAAAEKINQEGGGSTAVAVAIEWSDNGMINRYRGRS